MSITIPESPVPPSTPRSPFRVAPCSLANIHLSDSKPNMINDTPNALKDRAVGRIDRSHTIGR